jgi:hypothetical protein
MLIEGFLFVVTLTVGILMGMLVKYREANGLLGTIAKQVAEIAGLKEEIERKKLVIATGHAALKALNEQLRKVSSQAQEAGLKVVAKLDGNGNIKIPLGETVTIASGYRYDVNNS